MSYESNITDTDQVFIGEQKTIQFIIYITTSSDAAVAAGSATPQVITGWAITWVLKDIGGTTLLTKTVGSGITITDGPDGVLQVALSAANTGGLVANGTYHQLLTRTDVGFEAVLARGTVAIRTP